MIGEDHNKKEKIINSYLEENKNKIKKYRSAYILYSTDNRKELKQK